MEKMLTSSTSSARLRGFLSTSFLGGSEVPSVAISEDVDVSSQKKLRKQQDSSIERFYRKSLSGRSGRSGGRAESLTALRDPLKSSKTSKKILGHCWDFNDDGNTEY